MKNSIFIGIPIILYLCWACDIKRSDIEPDAAFVRVYESGITDEAYYPKDIMQLDDGKYLILSALTDSNQSLSMSYPPITLIATDETGEVIDREILPETYSNAVPGWLNINGNPSFVCMDDITNEAVVIRVEVSNDALTYTELGKLGNDFPLYAYTDGDNLLLLSYDSWGSSVVTRYNTGLSAQWEASFTIATDLPGKITDHLLLDRLKPFFIANVKNDDGSTDYMVNCFEGSSLALLFFNGNTGSYNLGTGIYSFQEEAGLTAAMHLSGSTMALARYHSGNSYVYPLAEVNRNELINTKEMENDILITQLRAETPMDILLYEHHETEYITYASTTKSNQILLLFFNSETGVEEYSHTLGFGNPVEVTNIIATNDGGLAVLGKTWINSQYQRIIFYKLDKEQLLFEEAN